MEKIKKEKTAKKNIWWLWIIIPVIIIIASVFIVYEAVHSEKLNTPTNLYATTLNNGTVIVQVDKEKNINKYEFFITLTNGKTLSYLSTTNGFDATETMNTPGNYKIKCRALGETNKNHSEFTKEISFTKTQQLATPTISIVERDNKTQLQVISNNAISINLNYKFTLTYVDGEILKTTETEPATNSNGMIFGYFNLEELITAKGSYTLSCQLSCDNEFYTKSSLSTQLEYVVE